MIEKDVFMTDVKNFGARFTNPDNPHYIFRDDSFVFLNSDRTFVGNDHLPEELNHISGYWESRIGQLNYDNMNVNV